VKKSTVKKTRILIVDDSDDFRHRVIKFLSSEPDMEVVGEASNGKQAILEAKRLMPDVILMDVRMAEMNGIHATNQIKIEMPKIKIIILSIYNLREYMEAAVLSGASGYVVKKMMIHELIPTINNVMLNHHTKFTKKMDN